MDNTAFNALEQTFRSDGPEAVFDLLIGTARREKNYRMLFGARLMQVRHRLGLPLIDTDPVPGLTDEQRPVYEKEVKQIARPASCFWLPATSPPHGLISRPLASPHRWPPPSKT